MSSDISYRPVQPEDGPALAALIASSPSAGFIGFSYEYTGDLLEINRAFAEELHGITAASNFEIVGMVLGDLRQVQLDEQVSLAIYISNLRVNIGFRRRGIARGLSEYGLDYARKNLPKDAVMYAAIPDGNISMALVRSYQFKITRPIQGGIVPMRQSAPPPKNDLWVRLATDDDYDAVANGMNEFYSQHNLWSPVSKSYLQKFVAVEVGGIRPNYLFVVERAGELLGGLSLSDRTGLVRMKLTRTPAWVRFLGGFLGILPESGILDTLTVRKVWFKDNELEAIRFLWETLRYDLRHTGNSLGIAYDPRDRLADVFQIPFWLPMFKARYAIKTYLPVDPERLTYCLAGP